MCNTSDGHNLGWPLHYSYRFICADFIRENNINADEPITDPEILNRIANILYSKIQPFQNDINAAYERWFPGQINEDNRLELPPNLDDWTRDNNIMLTAYVEPVQSSTTNSVSTNTTPSPTDSTQLQQATTSVLPFFTPSVPQAQYYGHSVLPTARNNSNGQEIVGGLFSLSDSVTKNDTEFVHRRR